MVEAARQPDTAWLHGTAPPSSITEDGSDQGDGRLRERERESRCVLQLTDGHLRMKEKRDLRGTRAKRPRHTPSACPKASDL